MKNRSRFPSTGPSAPFIFSQSGQSMAEFLVILPVILLLIFGAIQFALIFHAKITLNYAAFEAVRYGSLGQGRFNEVREGFARGLAPLYSYFESDDHIRKKRKGNIAGDQIEAYQMARNRVYNEFDSRNRLVRIERLNPTDSSFLDFASDEEIPNDNLMYRTSRMEEKSQSSIQDANLLHLRVTYWYPLYVPLVNKLIFNTFICCKTVDIADSFCKWSEDPVCMDKNQEPVIPLTATAVMRMQTPLVKSDGYFNKNQLK
ncbi:MAG: pilus assembly protein [Desulfobulbaceae bacterium]|nr:pilus assembly protein [Desulfobulbaceae bacterium]